MVSLFGRGRTERHRESHSNAKPMADQSDFTGRRATVEAAGDTHVGTVTSVTYTLKGGQPVVRVELDEPTADGRTELAYALSNVEFGAE